MRLFIAIELSDEIKEGLSMVQSHLKYSGADVKWVETDNIHLTLKFLGEADEDKVKRITSALDAIGSATHPFDISVKEIGAFPRIEHPRVVWAGLDKGAEESKLLAGTIDEKMSEIGFQKEERAFSPHMTIGRVKDAKNKDALKEKVLSLDPAMLDLKPQLISSVILFRSTLTPKGSIYTKIHETRLGQ
ncbi:MAG: RNA 2',3'-cyclic phosphodiesterase [Candidatus Omnitrophota bacterium]|jgi:2'-5' RNA ligase